MNNKQQKWIRLAVQIVRKALKIFHKEYLEPENSNKKKELPYDTSQNYLIEEDYPNRGSDSLNSH